MYGNSLQYSDNYHKCKYKYKAKAVHHICKENHKVHSSELDEHLIKLFYYY